MTTIFQALNDVMTSVQAVGKKERNNAQGFNFRGIDAVVNAVGPALRAFGVIVAPKVLDYQYGQIEIGKGRTPMGHARLVVSYTFYGPEGDSIEAIAVGEAMDSGDKATAKAMSVAFRTALLQALCLPTDEPDPDQFFYERSEDRDYADSDSVGPWLLRLADAGSESVLAEIAAEIKQAEISPADKETLLKGYSEASKRLKEAREA